MDLSVTVSDDGRYIVIKGKGVVQSGEFRHLIPPVIEAYGRAANLGTRRLLADMTEARAVLSTIDIYELINRWVGQEPAIHRGMDIALLVAPEDHSYDFLETVAKNAGFHIKLFRDKEKALEFLLPVE
jgi:hypothetical protein